MSSLPLHGWAPFRLYWQGSEPGVEWCYLGANRFTEPFFETSMQLAIQAPFNNLFRFRTPIAALAEWQRTSPGLKPTGFIFHLSRCGSTLITQLLASLPENAVISEAGLLDGMLRSEQRAPQSSLEQRVCWLQWLVSALGQRRTGAERHLFIKFDPRSIVMFPFLRLAFPAVPWIFVYRNPVEVMVSNLRGTAQLLTPSLDTAAFLSVTPSQVAAMDEEEFLARVLGVIAQTAMRCATDYDGLLINYPQLPEIVWGAMGRHLGITLTNGDLEQLKQVATRDAKHPERRFSGDTESKNKEASERVRLLAEHWIGPHYARLEELRTRREGTR